VTLCDRNGSRIEGHKNSVLFKLNCKKRHPLHIKDEELRFIDDLLDDQIINKLLYCYLFFSGNTVPVVISGFQWFSNMSFDSFAMHEKASLK